MPLPANPERQLSLRILEQLNRFYCRFYHRVQPLAPCSLPPTGPAILICNHTSGLDPLLIQSTCRRLIVWMMAREYYEVPGLKWLFDKIEAIPVARSGKDLSATRSALRALAHNRIVGIFPEGKIETTDQLLPFQTGAALLAIRSNTPIYPAYITGTQRHKSMARSFALPQRGKLIFGNEVNIPRDSTNKDILQSATSILQAAVDSLRQKVTCAHEISRENGFSAVSEENSRNGKRFAEDTR